MLKLCSIDASNQLIRDIGAFNPHDAFLSVAITQKIDAAIPHDFLIHDGELLVNIGSKNNADIGTFYKIQYVL